jgi:ubiquinol-cytochrome c reductase cytochrome c subunit
MANLAATLRRPWRRRPATPPQGDDLLRSEDLVATGGFFSRRFLKSRSRFAGPAVVLALGVAAFSVFAFGGVDATGNQALVSTSQADINAGAALYTEHCQSCHGVNGVGGNNGSPELIDAGAAAADFYLTTGRMPLNNPHDQPIRHHPYFNAEQIRQIDAYVNALPAINHENASGPTIPTPEPLCSTADQTAGTTQPGCVTLTEGQQYFATNCAQCHQGAGSGGMLSKGNVVPSLKNANITQVLEAMRIGPKPMPIFGNNQLNASQASAIAHYVQYLHKPADPGGLGIGHFGPVAEGFVGIILGLGALLLASRWIGNRG